MKLVLSKRLFATLTTVLFLFSLNIIPALAVVDGSLDESFGAGGIVTTNIANDFANEVVTQSDGKIVVVGYTLTGSDSDFAVVRYNTNGSLDTSFGTGGKVTTDIGSADDDAYSIALQTDGKIVVVGYTDNGSNTDFAVVRYNTNGSLDTSFDSDGKLTTDIGTGTDDYAYSIALQTDGKIVVVGFTYNVSNSDFAVVRYNTNGSLDTSFGTGGKVTTSVGSSDDDANGVVIQSDGKIVVAGNTYVGTFTDFAVVRYNTSGSLDESFGAGGIVTTSIGSRNDFANEVVTQSDGKIVVAGSSSNGLDDDFAVVRYNTNGSLDTSFGTDGKVTTNITDDYAVSLVLQSDGKIVVAGTVYIGSNLDFAVVRYNTNGSLDTSFGTGGKVTTNIGSGRDEAFSVVLQSDGKIVVAGNTYVGTFTDFAVVRYTVVRSNTNGSLSWVGSKSISCPAPNPWVNEELGFATNAKPVLVSAENTVGKTITQGSYDSLKSSGVVFDTVSKKVSTATETLPIYGCKDKLLSGKVNQPIQFIAGGYTLQSDAHGYINTADLKWHDTNSVTLYTNTAAFMHTIKFTKTGKYVVVLTEQPDTSRGLIPTYGVRSIRFVININ